MKNLRRLAQLAQVKTFTPKPLEASEHAQLGSRLQHFKRQDKRLHLEYSFQAAKHYDMIIEKMNRIGRLADSMDHHPDWTLSADRLVINLNTHDIKDISQKDYLLAFIAEQVLYANEEEELLKKWNT